MVDGDVQGVGFRSARCRRATELGLSGWVSNIPDGRVEVQAEGTSFELNELRLWCERDPSAANVRMVRLSQMPITGDDWFEIRP
ncbi:MAG: acylphosphatase [Synechococcus sp.]